MVGDMVEDTADTMEGGELKNHDLWVVVSSIGVMCVWAFTQYYMSDLPSPILWRFSL